MLYLCSLLLCLLQMLSQAYNNKVRIFHGDVMTFDMSNLFPRELEVPWDSTPPKIHIIGNLPFNVSTPLIVRFLRQMSEHSGAWSYGRARLTLTFQEEVGERMTANRNHQQRSRLSIMTQYLCRVTHEFSIPGKAFVPAPKVDVAVVTLAPLKRPQIDVPFQMVEKVVRHIFQYRQKYCMAGIQ
jgi:dimethyladenosine transferase 1